ncbi:MAG: ribonuclease P protein component [Armatimonadetes bacterium]|nr:ribonuclease P protein component [Armatimonadota bacterium]MBS1700147.1 ribonuclease P protein component [Armatimonadota bacterium]MBS1726712.1 ribonuclease P protein component [Armatimonadota bacterium]
MKGPSKRRFDEIYNQGRRFRGDFLTLIVTPGQGLVGIATSKKLGAKPQRNRQKRRIRAMISTQMQPTTQDWVLVVGMKCLRTEYATLRIELTHLIGEANSWVGGSASS